MFMTAAWDAHALASFANLEPDGHDKNDVTLYRTWMDPDYPQYQKWIAGNLNRASEFMDKKTFEIILSCRDSKNWCPIQKDGKSVDGYAWTYDGWFGYKCYYITMCNPFFQTDDLGYKIDQIEQELAEGNKEKAIYARWQASIGQMFLHEMIHLNSTSKGEPHIEDMHVDPDSAGNWAYESSKVHQLARRMLTQGGGASRASRNADSYTWLANSKYWWALTGYFPQPDNYKKVDLGVSAEVLKQDQTAFRLDFGTITPDTSEAEITRRKNAILDGFGNASPSGGSNPSTGKSLSIVMMSMVNSHSGSASTDISWKFYATSVAKAINECANNGVEEIIPFGGISPKLPPSTDIKKLPWPAGEFKLKIEGEECEYKSNGENSGRLFCPNKQIACKEDNAKSKEDGVKKCGSRQSLHAAVYCDF